MGSGKLLRKAIKKYGIKNFKKEILVSKIPIREYADKAEIFYIARERAKHKAEYNIVDGGQGFRGQHVTKETKDKIRQKALGNKRALGNVLSSETKQQMGESRIGNRNNGVSYIRCIETNEIHRTREWFKYGFANAYNVARGRQKTCGGFHFEYVS